jgi:hypothetical protein
MDQAAKTAAMVDYHLSECRAIMSSFGDRVEPIGGAFEEASECINRFWEAVSPMFTSASRKSTGFEILIYEFAGRQQQKKNLWNAGQTLCFYLDAEHDEPLLAAFFGAQMARELNEDFDLLLEPPSHLHAIETNTLRCFVSTPCISSVLFLRGLVWRTPILGLLSQENPREISTERTERTVRRIARERSPEINEEEASLEMSSGDFELMARAEKAAEARVQEELDDSMSVYELVLNDE